MNSTDLIYAEAAVRSKRVDYRSIFDPQAQIAPETLKRYLADPKVVQEAVQMLKKTGFTVTSVGKYSISLLATRRLLDKTFEVTIVAEEVGKDSAGNPIFANTVQGAQRFGYIDTSSSAYKDLLAGIALPQPSVYTGAEDCPPREDANTPWPLCPEDILTQLNFGETNNNVNWQKVIHVVIIDSGFFEHDYFNKKHFSEAIVIVDQTIEQKILNRKIEEYEKLITMGETEKEFFELCDKWCKEKIDDNELYKTIDDSPEFVDLYDVFFPNGVVCKQVTKLLEDAQKNFHIFRDHRQRYHNLLQRSDQGNKLWQPDPEKHGAVVVSYLLTVAPQAKVTLIKLPESNEQGADEEAFNHALSLKPDIISMSRGGFQDPQKTNFANQNGLATLVSEAFQSGWIVLFAAGNNEKDGLFQEGKGKISTQAQIKGCITVGGAYRESNDAIGFTASDFAHGYPDSFGGNEAVRQVPDICGLCGPKDASAEDNGFFIVPRFKLARDGYESTWGRSNGTSISTPQVAGVCALMKQVFRGLTPSQAIEILRETATPVKQGNTAQEVPVANLNIGVVDIEAAVTMAAGKNLEKSL